MRKIKTAILFTLVMILELFNLTGQSNENIFIPSGKPVILVFTDASSSFNKLGNSSQFSLARAYLGYEHNFSRTFSSRVVFDVGDPGVGGFQMTAYVKNAYLMYNNKGFTARVGMIPTDQLVVPEKHWGYRYIIKSFQDQYGLGPTADIGAGIEYSPAKFISIDASLLNGEGYKKIQSDSTFKATFGLTLKPADGLVLRAYYDRMKKVNAQTTISLFAGYTYKAFRIGLEYDIQKNNKMQAQNNFSGISTWASLQFAEKFSVFTRYDYLSSETIPGEAQAWNYHKDGSLFIAGLDYTPVKGVKIAPLFMGWSPKDRAKYFTSTVGLWFEIRY